MKARKKYQRKEYCITSAKIKNEIKFVLLSDFHGKKFGENNRELTDDIAKEKPDIILVAGDMIVADSEQYVNSRESAYDLIGDLTKICPVYYGMGNHETKVRVMKKFDEFFGKSYAPFLLTKNAIPLANKSKRVCVRGDKLVISGLEADLSYYKKIGKLSMETRYLEEVLGKGEREELHILIAHNPHYFDTYAEWGADLTVSGHMHGGVIGCSKGGGVISPQFRLFPQYVAGMFKKAGKTLIISRGIGDYQIPVRIRNPREYVVIRICPEKQVLENARETL